ARRRGRRPAAAGDREGQGPTGTGMDGARDTRARLAVAAVFAGDGATRRSRAGAQPHPHDRGTGAVRPGPPGLAAWRGRYRQVPARHGDLPGGAGFRLHRVRRELPLSRHEYELSGLAVDLAGTPGARPRAADPAAAGGTDEADLPVRRLRPA